jgi:diketogulonate reductase-like aldo/keto reductase
VGFDPTTPCFLGATYKAGALTRLSYAGTPSAHSTRLISFVRGISKAICSQLFALEFRDLGRTGEKVTTIGMGTWNIGNYSSPDQKAAQVRALNRGIELGINLIDTAEIYSRGRSEEVVAEAIRGQRDKVFIATKVSAEHLHHDDLISSCEASLRRLGTSHIDLYQVHWPSDSIPIKETMGAMEELVRAGKVRFIGISNFDVKQTEEARASLSKNDVVSNQVEYSLSTRQVESDILPYCEKEKMTLIAYSPLARGRIATSGIPKELLAKYKMTPAQAMLNWVTRSEQVVAIPKAADIAHLEENASSVDVRMTESEYAQISR